MTLNDLLLQNARTCDSGFLYPQDLIDGLSHQLIEELICMDDGWLEFYEPCEEAGCVFDYGPQPLALRPEVLAALETAALSRSDFISITAGYRDIAMQYYSRWYKENCDWNFNAAIPGESNHQGGRAVDVRYYTFWSVALLENGFEHPIADDEPHFELTGDATYREESEQLKELSVLAFQQLWNRNYPEYPVEEDGVYDTNTKEALGNSPVEGFPSSSCDPMVGDDVGFEPVPDAAIDEVDPTIDIDEPDAPDDLLDEPLDVGQVDLEDAFGGDDSVTDVDESVEPETTDVSDTPNTEIDTRRDETDSPSTPSSPPETRTVSRFTTERPADVTVATGCTVGMNNNVQWIGLVVFGCVGFGVIRRRTARE